MVRLLSLAAVLAICFGALNADDKTKPGGDDAKAKMFATMMKHATPGQEHQMLSRLAGTWKYTANCWMDPSSKEPMKMSGTTERKSAMGGRFLCDHVKGTDAEMPFEGMGCWGYDNGTKKYWYVWVDSFSTGRATAEGKYDAGTKTLTMTSECYCPCEEKVVKGRDETKIISDDEVVQTFYRVVDGKETKAMEIHSKRVK